MHSRPHLAVHALTHPAVHAAHSRAGLAVPALHRAGAEAALAKPAVHGARPEPAGAVTIRLRQGPSAGEQGGSRDASDQQHLPSHLWSPTARQRMIPLLVSALEEEDVAQVFQDGGFL
jgi:hypothetical protein